MTINPIQLPLRITAGAVRLGIQLPLRAAALLGNAVEALRPAPSPSPSPPSAPPSSPRPSASAPRPAPAVQQAPEPPGVTPVSPIRSAEATPPTPLTPADAALRAVDDEPELVRSSADPEAVDGAGAQLAVAQPWAGYDALSAGAVVDRLATAGREEIAMIELYERTHKQRRTVLDAAEKQLAGAG